MGIKWIAILLVLEIALFVTGSRVQQHGSFSGPKKSIKVHNNSNRPIVKTIQSEDGDIIECIDILKQPAFDHPALKDHKIQMVPTHSPTEEIPMEKEYHSKVITQLWQKSGSCPDGTIPIRKMQRNVKYARKEPQYYHHYNQTGNNVDIKLLNRNHSFAILHSEGFAYYGGKGDIRVWNPEVELNNEYSSSQVALQSGPHDKYEAVKSGWTVNPGVYKDRSTRFFVYWTVDGSKNTGCFDHTCPGFVQTNKDVALGATIYSKSSPSIENPEELSIYIHKDPKTHYWWVQYQGKDIGYWPTKLFYKLKYQAETVQWGGEVYSSKVGVSPHTATQMGNGEYAGFEYGRSGSVRRIRVLLSSLVFKFPDYASAYADEDNCYNSRYVTQFFDDPEFYYGGPGRGSRCP